MIRSRYATQGAPCPCAIPPLSGGRPRTSRRPVHPEPAGFRPAVGEIDSSFSGNGAGGRKCSSDRAPWV